MESDRRRRKVEGRAAVIAGRKRLVAAAGVLSAAAAALAAGALAGGRIALWVGVTAGAALVGFLLALLAVWAHAKRRRGAPWPGGPDDHLTTGLVFVDARDRYGYVNGSAERFLGHRREELTGRGIDEVTHAMRMPLLVAADVLRHGKRPAVTARFPLNGRTVAVEFSRNGAGGDGYEGFAAVIRDMDERCEFCGHMVRVERMTVLGELAAAMAHEINSPLSGVMESVRIIRKNSGNWEKTEKFLPLVQQGLEQIEATVRQMLKFATPHEPPRARLVLEDVIKQCVEFLGYRQSETGVEIQTALTTERTIVMASEHAIGQVLINLINNAFDATAGRQGGLIIVRSELLPESGEVMVQVIDNGPGVPAQVRSRIFEPFFTTKASGSGTGLGLSISARIAARHRGRIMVSESDSGGAVFSLVLPLVGRHSGEENA